MASNQIDWQRYEEKMKAAQEDWDNFPRKDLLSNEKCGNIDLLFYLINDTLNRNDRSEATEHQLQLLLRALAIAFRILTV
jgi:hypothetical protein